MPEAGPIVHRDLRRLLLRSFPFAIYYRLTVERVEVRACLHQRRHPGAWRRRS
jgi:plasmid stabilization system protein ParE